jgi:FkbM family methyltransferase
MTVIFGHQEEEDLKEAFFGHSATGFFVEVGANDPEHESQTFRLESRGWTGVLVEPQPQLVELLRQRRKARVYAVACSAPENSGKYMTLHLAGIFSSLDPMLKTAKVRPHGAIDVPIMTLDQILTDAGAPSQIDFLAIDVEGHEIDVLTGFDFDRWRPRLILLEDLVLDRRLHHFMGARGYRWMRRTNINSWYVPAAAAPRLTLLGRWQFVRKYYIGTPFRRAREALRRLRVTRRSPACS